MTTTTDTTTEAPGLPVASATAMLSRTRPGTGTVTALMEPMSALDEVIAGRNPYAIEGEPAKDADEPTKVLPPDSLAIRVRNLEVREESRESHLAEMTRERDVADERAEQMAANIGRLGARLVAWEAYALALAASVDFPDFAAWQADRQRQRQAQAVTVEPVAADQEQAPPSDGDLGDLVTVEPVEVSDG